jgi:hypothetical protein
MRRTNTVTAMPTRTEEEQQMFDEMRENILKGLKDERPEATTFDQILALNNLATEMALELEQDSKRS